MSQSEMDLFKIDTSKAPIPTQDGDVNTYISEEATAVRQYFSSSKKVVFINGMKNSGLDHAHSAIALSLVQMSPVTGLFNQSNGLISDLWQCLMDKIQFQGIGGIPTGIIRSGQSFWDHVVRGYRSPKTAMIEALSRNYAQVKLFELLRSIKDKHCEVFAHSQGNLLLSNVLQAIGAVDGPSALSHFTVHTFGSPAVFYPPCVQKYEHGYTFDPINWLSGFDASFTISKVGMPTGSSNPITHGFLWYLRDDPRFIINRFRTGGFGMTFNMDEEGLAGCLAAMGANIPRVDRVIRFLNENQNSDADDVVLLYIKKIRNNSSVRDALKSSQETVKLLVRTLDEGWTTSQEKEAIEWLKGVRQ